jgi:drug/metabolite transporter (DMT)-like permease
MLPIGARQAVSSSRSCGEQTRAVSPTLLALLAAASLAISSLFTKRMVGAYPPRQLIGPLLGLNALLVVPFLPFVRWHVSWAVALLHLASVTALVVGSWCIFELFVHGSASAVAVGQAMAPIPAVVFTALLLATPVTSAQAVAAGIVSLAVLAAVGGSFGRLRPSYAIALVALAASLNGLLVVLTKMLTDRGLGVAEIYFVRTAVSAAIWVAIALPREIPRHALPQLFTRSSFQTGYFVLIILALQRGSPATVQTLAATTPLMLLVATFLVRRRALPARLVFASCAVVLGVALAAH